VQQHTCLTDQINGAYYQNGIVIVAAAGNTSGGAVTYPATLDAAIAVSATDTTNAFASFSASGSKVEIAAPGTTVTDVRGITSTCLGDISCAFVGSEIKEGTSFAAPHVAAAAAILRSYNSSWSNFEIRRRLGAGATDLGAGGRDPLFGYGLLNIPGAIAADPPPPSVSIIGNTEIEAYLSCQWSAAVSGGTSPYSYSWTVNGQSVGDNSSSLSYTNNGSPFTIAVTVTDAAGGVASDDHAVAIVAGMYCT
jgi:minor extracellular protease Epr